MRIILIAGNLSMLVQYSIMSDVDSGTMAVSCNLIEATLRSEEGSRVTLDDEDRMHVMDEIGGWIEQKVIEHSRGLSGFDAWYNANKIESDEQNKVDFERALILARAAYDAGQLSMSEVAHGSVH